MTFPVQLEGKNAIFTCKTRGPTFGYFHLSVKEPFNQFHNGISFSNTVEFDRDEVFKIGLDKRRMNLLTNEPSGRSNVPSFSKFTISEIEVWAVTLSLIHI